MRTYSFHPVHGARDMLREAAKQFRLLGDTGHATMCERHADSLDAELHRMADESD